MTESQESPVRHFCAQLDAFVRASGQTRSYVVSRHPMSDSQVYAVLAGTVKTPPSFDRMVVPIVEICGGGPAAVAQWRTHHDTMVRVYELQKSLRRKGTAETSASTPEDTAAESPAARTPAAGTPDVATPDGETPGVETPGVGTPPAGAPGAAAPGADVPPAGAAPRPGAAPGSGAPPGFGVPPGFDVPPGYNRFASAEPRPARRPRRPLLVIAAIVAVLGVAAGGLTWALADRAGSGPDGPAAAPVAGGASTADPASPCTGTAPAGGGDLLDTPLPDEPGPLSRPWWTNEAAVVTMERFDTHSWAATVPESVGADPWALLAIRGCLPVTAGHRYRLDFTATASVGATLRARVQHNEWPYPESLMKNLTVGPDPQSFSYEFTGNLTSPTSELTFQLGGNPAMRVEVTDVVLTDLGA
ncbi:MULTISPECIES: hypothetical protein [Catenuloplanes]|uniref:CBM-cenC domain-containing protein n=1 Tax=Catenuloplanes niger TaxID=587534 RepID=A0AAE3ZXJ8_9ACTN|nr:hypothetical protein [Catenuloplanes niger]MDR7325958.1 hypothetical protein [Catenuloplanes niger]